MRKSQNRRFTRVLALVMILLTMAGITGCRKERQVQYEVPSYQGQLAEGQTKSEFNPELFYRNQKYTNSCDPFVLDNTSRDGYYYVYRTEGSCFCYRSKDLMNWEPVGNALDNLTYEADGSYSEVRKVTWARIPHRVGMTLCGYVVL